MTTTHTALVTMTIRQLSALNGDDEQDKRDKICGCMAWNAVPLNIIINTYVCDQLFQAILAHRRKKKKEKKNDVTKGMGKAGFTCVYAYSIEMIFIRFYVTIITSLVKRSLTAIEMEKWQKIDGRSKRRKRYLFSLKWQLLNKIMETAKFVLVSCHKFNLWNNRKISDCLITVLRAWNGQLLLVVSFTRFSIRPDLNFVIFYGFFRTWVFWRNIFFFVSIEPILWYRGTYYFSHFLSFIRFSVGFNTDSVFF